MFNKIKEEISNEISNNLKVFPKRAASYLEDVMKSLD